MFDELLQRHLGENILQDYALSFGVFFITFFVLQLFKSIVLLKIRAFSKQTKNNVDNMISETLDSLGWPFYFIISLYIATRFIELESFIKTAIHTLTLVIVTFYIVLSLQRLLEFLLFRLIRKHSEEEVVDSTISNFIKNALRVTLWVGAVIVVLQNLGLEIGAFLGSLGIAGIAIAFALQNVLTDIFAFFSIYFDKPFKKGDFIIVGNDMGTIEHIGVKSTRVRTLQGQELVISNTELTQTRVNNYKRMEERRVVFKFGVEYETPVPKVKKIPEILKKIIKEVTNTRFDRAHFQKFGDFSLDFEVVYFVTTQDYNLYMDVQQEINYKIMEEFKKERIDFAYPTQVIYVNK